MPTALDRARYFGAHLSENIAETPEGYRICRNAVIGRTGFQTYKAAELIDPDGLLGDRNPDEDIEVWRDPAEVFSDATLASFEGKTFTLTHPDELLTPESEREHHAGHVQNVRRGSEPLDSGDVPILADIIVTDRDAIRAIDTGARELSCGYSYELAREGYRFEQRKILGNHVALVEKGRAGAEARINDAAPKETPKVKNYFKHLLGLGFQSFAKDAKPEEVSEALEAMREGEQKPATRSTGRDNEGSEGAAASDAEKAAMDRKKRMHDMLDRMLDESAKAEEEREEQDDADLEELRSILGKGKDSEEESEEGEDAEEKEEKEEKEEGEDAEIVNAEPVLTPEERPKSVFDAQKTLAMLNAFKPFVARVKDKKLHAAFDTMVKSVKSAVKDEKDGGNKGGGYGAFGKAASKVADSKVNDALEDQHRQRNSDWKPKESAGEKKAREQDEIYANAMKSRSRTARK